MMSTQIDEFTVRLAKSPQDLRAVQRLRYEVFVEELGGGGSLVDHERKLEVDRFDPHCDHMIVEHAPSGQIAGVYRLMSRTQAQAAGQFYSENEYDLGPLLSAPREVLELGRSCIHKAFRNGIAMHVLWRGLAQVIAERGIDVLFGVASFHGTDTRALAAPLSLLHHRHLAPPALRVRARPPVCQSMDIIPENELDRPAAMVAIPSLIKAYLRLGGCVGEGAYIDHDFNTTDVCLILDINAMNPAQAKQYQRQPS